MATLTTTADLLGGVGEFVKVPAHELSTLLPENERVGGFGTGSLSDYHDAAWARVCNDFEREGFSDLDNDSGSMGTSTTNLLKAASCHVIMGMLYRRSATMSGKDSIAAQAAAYHFKEYERIKSTLYVMMPSGKTTQMGGAVRMWRG